jgi:uncharacterized protein YerC
MHAPSMREIAITLRQEGYSYPYISKETGLSKSTLSGWLTDVPYTPNPETIEAYGKARAAAGERKAQIRQEELEIIRQKAENEVGNLSERDLFMFGLGLYLGEGAKTHNTVNIANADPGVIRIAIAWFKSAGVEAHQLSARVHLYPDRNVEECLAFWSNICGIPLTQFQKTYIDMRVDKKCKKKGKLPFGTLYLSIRSRGKKEHGVLFLRRILMLIEAILRRT